MNIRKLTPAILTLLVFLLSQGLGTILLFGIGMLVSPGFSQAVQDYISGKAQGIPMLELIPIPMFALCLMAVNIIAVLICRYLLRNIRFVTATDIASIQWRPATLALAAGISAAVSTSILTDGMELPDVMQQMSIAMSNNWLGLLALIIVGPVTEELLFREAIAGEMLRRNANPWLAILVSALAFSIAHLNLTQGLYALPIGILFGIIYYKTGNIVLTSILHILNNAIAATQMHIFGEDLNSTTFTELLGGPLNATITTILTAILSIILTSLLWNSNQAKPKAKNHTFSTE